MMEGPGDEMEQAMRAAKAMNRLDGEVLDALQSRICVVLLFYTKYLL